RGRMSQALDPESLRRALGHSTGAPSWVMGRPDDVPVPLVVLDHGGRVVDHNRFAEELFGGEHGLLRLNSPFMPLVGESVRSYVRWRDDVDAGPLRVRLRVGTRKISADLSKTQIPSDPPVTVLAVTIDERSSVAGAHRLAFEESATGIFVAETSGAVVAANRALLDIVGLDLDHVEGLDWRHLFLTNVSSEFAHDVHRDLLDELEWRGRIETPVGDGSDRILDLSLRVRPLDGPVGGQMIASQSADSSSDLYVVGYVADETEDDAAQDALRQAARLDGLTGLLNRTGFLEQLTSRFDEAQRDGRELTLLYLDLDNFKTLNDHFGHRYGDILLEAFSKRLRSSLKSSDIVGRVGGDEFVVLFDPGLAPEKLRIVVDKLRERLLDDYQLDDLTYTCTASFGSSEYPWDAASADQLIEYSDHAMYQAKSAGRNAHARFDRAVFRSSEARDVMLRAIEVGLDETQFVPFFQPLRSPATRALVGARAAMRWTDPTTGETVHLPEDFLPSIEGSPTSIRLGLALVEQVIAEIRSFPAGSASRVTINLNAVQCRAEELIALIERSVADDSVLVERLGIGVAESVFTPEDPVITKNLNRLRSAGVELTLDDFGTGSASVLSIGAFDFTRLDLSRRLLEAAVAKREPSGQLFAAAVAMGRRLGLAVGAIGVDGERALEVVIDAGCDVAQGDLLGAPMRAADFRLLLG
ncbi:MAG: putative bifunctional diguanylate cyclase/phosphodiesterase, partial [Ilumatobacter sp.]